MKEHGFGETILQCCFHSFLPLIFPWSNGWSRRGGQVWMVAGESLSSMAAIVSLVFLSLASTIHEKEPFPSLTLYYAWIRWKSHRGCALLFDFLLGKPGRCCQTGGGGEEKAEGNAQHLTEKPECLGERLCLDCGFPETPRPSGSSVMESGCGGRGGSSPGAWLVLQQCQPVLSCLPWQPASEEVHTPALPSGRAVSWFLGLSQVRALTDGPLQWGLCFRRQVEAEDFCFVTANLKQE